MSELNNREEFDNAINQEGRVVVLFTAKSWCAPCRQFAPHWKRAVDEDKDTKFYVVEEVDSHQWAMVGFNIMSVPTCHLYEDGEFVRNLKVPVGGLAFLADIRS